LRVNQTSEFSTQISIIPGSSELDNESGNIFSIDGHPDNHNIKVRWLSKNSVNLGYDLNGKEYLAEKMQSSINIHYRK
jgi:hypothetical protein